MYLQGDRMVTRLRFQDMQNRYRKLISFEASGKKDTHRHALAIGLPNIQPPLPHTYNHLFITMFTPTDCKNSIWNLRNRH